MKLGTNFLILIFSILLAVCVAKSAFADRILDDASLLRKISYRIRNHGPYSSEFRALEKAQSGESCQGQKIPASPSACVKRFIQSKMREYLSSPEYTDFMVFHFDELLSLRQNYIPPSLLALLQKAGQGEDSKGSLDFERYNSLDQLVSRVVTDNEEWDHLFTSNVYDVYGGIGIGENTNYGDIDFFFRAANGQLPLMLPEGGKIRITLDPRISAGFLTTARFLTAYFDNTQNEGRSRAAAVFKTAFCDGMIPSIERGAGTEETERRLALGQNIARFHKEKPSFLDLAHAKEDCKVCHYKLEPASWTFRGVTYGLDPNPSSGGLVYTDDNGKKIVVAVNGLGELGQEIVKQEKYVSCQTQHFWKWIIGGEYPSELTRREQITAAFNQLHRKPKDFIAYLVKQPEFLSSEEEDSAKTQVAKKLYSQAMTVLRHCDSCHSADLPRFTSLPIGGSTGKNAEWLKNISDALSLTKTPMGQGRYMPKATNAWQPTDTELQAISDWIKAGAPNSKGQRLEIKK